jgi:hypothetical protein
VAKDGQTLIVEIARDRRPLRGIEMLVGKQRQEFVGKMVFDPNPSPGYSGGRFCGVVEEAVEADYGRIYCMIVYDDDVYDYVYVEDKITTKHLAVFMERK